MNRSAFPFPQDLCFLFLTSEVLFQHASVHGRHIPSLLQGHCHHKCSQLHCRLCCHHHQSTLCTAGNESPHFVGICVKLLQSPLTVLIPYSLPYTSLHVLLLERISFHCQFPFQLFGIHGRLYSGLQHQGICLCPLIMWYVTQPFNEECPRLCHVPSHETAH